MYNRTLAWLSSLLMIIIVDRANNNNDKNLFHLSKVNLAPACLSCEPWECWLVRFNDPGIHT
jgi:hypothetical protein